MVRKIFRQLHIWLSIPLGVLMSITCFTGAMLIFEKELTPHLQSDYYYVENVEGEPLPMEELRAKVEASLDEGEKIYDVKVMDDAERSYIFHLDKRGKSKLCVNQYTGEVLGKPERHEFFATMFRMHRWLMDAPQAKGEMSAGKLIVGISTLAMAIVLISGIVLWWPKTLKMWRNRSQIALRKGWRRFWYDLHVSGGIYAVVLILIMALTGLVWSFEWYRDGFYALFGEDARTWLRALHTGDIGGMTTRIMWFIAAIIGATLPLTGYYLWIKRTFAKRSK
jgi:uncharacterized iron-regulated membrane protein